MSTEAYSLALENTLKEIKNVCPEISSTFIFREDGRITAKDEDTAEEAIKGVVDAFGLVVERAGAIGGLESVTFEGVKKRVKISRLNDFYVANVASTDADEKTIGNLTRVMIPTMLKLVEGIYPSIQVGTAEIVVPEPLEIMVPQTPIEESPIQVRVENFSGIGVFLNKLDKGYIDPALVVSWNEKFGEGQVTQIILENRSTGKSLAVGFEAFTDSKHEGKNVILLSKKVRDTLGIPKGEQILIRPATTKQENLSTTEIEPSSVIQEKDSETEQAPSESLETQLPDAPVSQLIVENLGKLGGVFRAPDSVRVDGGMIAKWIETFGKKAISHITIEEPTTGKNVNCKFQAIKDPSLEGKGVIQVPEKIQQTLEVKKGSLVVVKPIVDER